MAKLTSTIIQAAIDGFEAQKKSIDLQIAELRAMLSGGPAESTAATSEAPPKTRKKFSAAVRRKMALAQQARWAKTKGEAAPPAPAPAEAPKPKRKLSAAGRAAIIAATKKMWARKRAAQAKSATKRRTPAGKKVAGKRNAPKKKAPAPLESTS